MKKKLFAFLLAGVLGFSCMQSGCRSYAEGTEQAAEIADAANLVEDIQTTQAFKDEAVAESDINSIVMAGVNAPSAMNGQPWHFSVVTDKDTLQRIADDMSSGMPDAGTMPEGMTPPEGVTPPDDAEDSTAAEPPAANIDSGVKAGIADAPLVIIVSCAEGSELDAGLAAQNMSVEAQLLGYGTKIISSPTIALNGTNQAEYKELLGIPENMTAVCMILIGTADTEETDLAAGATERNALEDVATFLN